MTRAMRVSHEEVVAAYQRTGSVWRAGKELGLAGQTVHERLRVLGHPLAGRHWTAEEVDELRSLLGHLTLGQIAHQLGRTYAGIACKVSELGLRSLPNRRPVKIPRGAGYDRASVKRYTRQLDESGEKVTRFARRNGLGIEALVQAFERLHPEWWEGYKRRHSDIEERDCLYCKRAFIPANGKQVLCSRRCGATRRVDMEYFGGERRNTIGLAEGRCQLCAREVTKGLSSHHVLGKENDPENKCLIALCAGCHKAVTLLASRAFIDNPESWETLIQLVWLRKHGGDVPLYGVYACVELEALDADDEEDDLSAGGAA